MNSSKTKIFLTYSTAALFSLIVMVLIDYKLGFEAEFLNAWVIINKLAGIGDNLPDSLVIRKFGLIPSAIIMIIANAAIGVVLVQLFKFISNVTLKIKRNKNA